MLFSIRRVFECILFSNSSHGHKVNFDVFFFFCLKEIVYLKIYILTTLTHPQTVLNLYESTVFN